MPDLISLNLYSKIHFFQGGGLSGTFTQFWLKKGGGLRAQFAYFVVLLVKSRIYRGGLSWTYCQFWLKKRGGDLAGGWLSMNSTVYD